MSEPLDPLVQVRGGGFPNNEATISQLFDWYFTQKAGTIPQRSSTSWDVADGFSYPVVFNVSGGLSVANDVAPWVILPVNRISGVAVQAVCKTAPVGADLQIDVKYNVGVDIGGSWVTIGTYTGNASLVIADGKHASSLYIPLVTNYSAGFAFRLDVLQVGSGTAGSDLSVILFCNVK